VYNSNAIGVTIAAAVRQDWERHRSKKCSGFCGGNKRAVTMSGRSDRHDQPLAID